jgi:hypothetical protein
MIKLEFLVKLEFANSGGVGVSRGAGLASAVHLARSRNQQTIVFLLAITFFFA